MKKRAFQSKYCLTWSRFILCFTGLILYASKVKVSFQNIYSQTYLGKKTQNQQTETHKNQPPKRNQHLFTPQKAWLHSHRPALVQKLTHVTLGIVPRGGLLAGPEPQQSQESSGQWQHRAHKPRHRAHFKVLCCGLAVRKPAGGATDSSQRSHLSEHLLEISVSVGSNSASLLLSHFC